MNKKEGFTKASSVDGSCKIFEKTHCEGCGRGEDDGGDEGGGEGRHTTMQSVGEGAGGEGKGRE